MDSRDHAGSLLPVLRSCGIGLRVGSAAAPSGERLQWAVPQPHQEAAGDLIFLRRAHQWPDLDTGDRQQLRPARRECGGCSAGAESIGHHDPGASDHLRSLYQGLGDRPSDPAGRSHHDDLGGLHRPRLLHHHHAPLRCHQARSDHRDVCGLHIPWLRREPLDFAVF